jgi:hypothetical protein
VYDEIVRQLALLPNGGSVRKPAAIRSKVHRMVLKLYGNVSPELNGQLLEESVDD